jgi:hypothetical protein
MQSFRQFLEANALGWSFNVTTKKHGKHEVTVSRSSAKSKEDAEQYIKNHPMYKKHKPSKIEYMKESVERIDEYNTKTTKAIVTKDDKPVAIYPNMQAAQKDYYGKPGYAIGMRSASASERVRKQNPGIKIVEQIELVDEEKDPRLVRAGVKGFNKPKRTPGHPEKSHVVVAKDENQVKTIRFGEQGAETAGAPKKGESDRMKAKRKSFKARHAKNIAKGKMSAAYWADKAKW